MRLLLALAFLAACHPMPRPARASWKGAPAEALQAQPELASLPLQKRRLSDGHEVWTFRDCETSFTSRAGDLVTPSETNCCESLFLIFEGTVQDYHRQGTCSSEAP